MLLPYVLFCSFGAILSSKGCPCEKPELCEPVHVSGTRKELFLFSTTNETWRKWNWTAITTVIAFNYDDPELMCFAHAHKARYGMAAGIDPKLLTNHTATELWLNNTIEAAGQRFSDAINFDIEDPIAADSIERTLLTQLVKNLTQRFKLKNPMNQVSFDLAWQPGGVDGRYYDEKGIADVVDLVFVMSYDTQSQIKTGPCIAKANIPYDRIVTGYNSYLNLGIPASKIVMGLPWYGYHYTCIKFDSVAETCHIKQVPFRGVNCSDAAGSEIELAILVKLMNSTGAERKWDKKSLTPYFEYYDKTKQSWRQVWYDDPESLLIKLEYGFSTHLRGVGMWNADLLDYSDEPSAKSLTRTIWEIFTEWVLSDPPDNGLLITEKGQKATTATPPNRQTSPCGVSGLQVTSKDGDVSKKHSAVGGLTVCFGGAGHLVAILVAVLLVGVLNGFLLAVLLQRYRQKKMMKYRHLIHEDESGL